MQGSRRWGSRAALMLGVLAASATSALADDMSGSDVRDLGGGYQLYFGKEGLRVRKGGRSAPLAIDDSAPGATAIVGVEASASSVKLSYMPTCADVETSYSHDQLAARLDREEGANLLRKGKHAAAQQLLARAVALDPKYDLASHDQAVALVKLGRPDDAIAVLTAKIAANPMGAYVELERDRQLASLLGRPRLAHLRAATTGTVKIDPDSLSLVIARAPGGQLAFVDTLGTMASCGANVQLVLRDEDLRELAVLPLAGMSDYDFDSPDCDAGLEPITKAGRSRIRKRVAAANKTLAALGFAPVEVDPLKANEETRPGVRTLRFASGRALVNGEDGAVRLFQAGKLLFESPPGTFRVEPMTFRSAVLVPSEQRILVTEVLFGCYHQTSLMMSDLSLK